MSRLVIVAPDGDFYNSEVFNNYEHAKALKDYLDERNISYDGEINNGHKLCLDLAREGYWIFGVTDTMGIMYIGKDVTNEQFDWYSQNTDFIDQMNVISVLSWYDPDYKVAGYNIIEEGSLGFNTFEKRRERINDLVIEKNKDYNKSNKKTKFGLFRRAK